MADDGLYCPWCKQQVPEATVQNYYKTSKTGPWKQGTSRPQPTYDTQEELEKAKPGLGG